MAPRAFHHLPGQNQERERETEKEREIEKITERERRWRETGGERRRGG